MYINSRVIGDKIFVRDTDGDYIEENFKPSLFFPSQNGSDFESIHGEPLVESISGGVKDFKNKLYNYKKNGTTIYGDGSILNQFHNQRYKGKLFTDFDKVKIFNIDIEVDSNSGFPHAHLAEQPINAITIKCFDNYYTWALSNENNDQYINKRENVFYSQFDDEQRLLENFIDFWAKEKPHVITGWNIETFDIPYIYNRIVNLFGAKIAKRLSPYNICKERIIRSKFGEQQTYELYGISVVDYLTIYKKFVPTPRENYKLDTIAEVELNEKKLDYEEYGNLFNLYRENFQKFVDYNIKDVELVHRIDQKRNLLRLVITIANFGRVNYEGVLSPIITWESTIYNHLREKNIIPEIKKKSFDKDSSFAGAFVIPPVIDMHEWIIAFDLDSLYPSNIRQWNIGPETIVDPFELPEELQSIFANVDMDDLIEQKIDLSLLKEHNLTLAPSGYFFRNDKQSFLSELMELLFTDRKKEKNSKLTAERDGRHEDALLHDTFQNALKVLLNSLYGALGSDRCQYFDLRLAESITKCGKLSLLSTAKILDDRLKKHNDNMSLIIAGDTDSVVYDSIISVDCNEVKIGDYFNSLPKTNDKISVDGTIVRPGKGRSPSVSSDLELEYNNVVYCMEHEVEKEMFEITVDGDSVIVTEDHSIMVERAGKLVEVKPRDILSSDTAIKIDFYNYLETQKQIKIKSLGIQKRKVYDIEVENNHNFFANAILVHNSVYLSISGIVNNALPDASTTEKLDWADQFGQNVIYKMLCENFDSIKNYLNCFSSNLHMSREVIADRGIWCKKKRYALNVLDDEGYRPEKPKIKIMGLEIIKSTTPKWCQERLKPAVEMILSGSTEREIKEYIDGVHVEFMKQHVIKIAMNKGVNYIEKYTDKVAGRAIAGTQSHIRGAINYNHFHTDGRMEPITDGDKIKLVPLLKPNHIDDNIIAFKDILPEEYFKFIDYNTLWEKGFLNPLKKVTDVIKWELKDSVEAQGLF